jgi:hypothetical protein
MDGNEDDDRPFMTVAKGTAIVNDIRNNESRSERIPRALFAGLASD